MVKKYERPALATCFLEAVRDDEKARQLIKDRSDGNATKNDRTRVWNAIASDLTDRLGGKVTAADITACYNALRSRFNQLSLAVKKAPLRGARLEDLNEFSPIFGDHRPGVNRSADDEEKAKRALWLDVAEKDEELLAIIAENQRGLERRREHLAQYDMTHGWPAGDGERLYTHWLLVHRKPQDNSQDEADRARLLNIFGTRTKKTLTRNLVYNNEIIEQRENEQRASGAIVDAARRAFELYKPLYSELPQRPPRRTLTAATVAYTYVIVLKHILRAARDDFLRAPSVETALGLLRAIVYFGETTSTPRRRWIMHKQCSDDKAMLLVQKWSATDPLPNGCDSVGAAGMCGEFALQRFRAAYAGDCVTEVGVGYRNLLAHIYATLASTTAVAEATLNALQHALVCGEIHQVGRASERQHLDVKTSGTLPYTLSLSDLPPSNPIEVYPLCRVARDYVVVETSVHADARSAFLANPSLQNALALLSAIDYYGMTTTAAHERWSGHVRKYDRHSMLIVTEHGNDASLPADSTCACYNAVSDEHTLEILSVYFGSTCDAEAGFGQGSLWLSAELLNKTPEQCQAMLDTLMHALLVGKYVETDVAELYICEWCGTGSSLKAVLKRHQGNCPERPRDHQGANNIAAPKRARYD